MRDGNVSPHFEKGETNVFNSDSYLVAYNWKGLLTRKIMSLRKGFYSIPDQNQLCNLTRCHFG